MITPGSIAEFPFCALEFGTQGEAMSPTQQDRLVEECRRSEVTDLIFLAHGFRCDADDATTLYTALLTNLRTNLSRTEFARKLSTRRFAASGVYWPSKEFREVSVLDRARDVLVAASGSRHAQDQVVASALLAFKDDIDDPTEGFSQLSEVPGSELLDKLRAERQPTLDEDGGIDCLSCATSVLGAVDKFLNLLTWNTMKNLSGLVGMIGLAEVIEVCRSQVPGLRMHLVGHSLGGRLMTACCKRLGERGTARIASLSLLEAAFSHFGFSPDSGDGQPGFFRGVVESSIVRGPMISTFSRQDSVVGTAYALASRLARDRLQSIGDSSDPYGGIGHNGARSTPESTVELLHQAGTPYSFRSAVVTCLDGSATPERVALITSHGDVTNPHVTYAVASAITSWFPTSM